MKTNCKKQSSSKYILGLIFFLFISFGAFSQNDVASIVQAGTQDINKLGNLYLKPFGASFGSSLNAGWYNTAKNHKLLGFDVTFTLNSMIIPKSDKLFDLSDQEFNTLKINSKGNGTESPTIFGSATAATPIMDVVAPNPLYGIVSGQPKDTVFTSFQMPKGIGLNMMMMPNLQLGLGVLPGTELTLRYSPVLEAMGKVNGKITYYGAGFMFNIGHFIKAMPFSLAVQGAYSKFNYNYNLPNQLTAPTGSVYQNGEVPKTENYNSQKLLFDVDAATANLILSKKIAMVTIYGSGGYNFSKTSFNLDGVYPLVTDIGHNPADAKTFKKKIVSDFTDPLAITTDYSSFRGNLGVKVNWLIMTFHAEYTYAYYQAITAGIGISVR